MPVCSWVDCNEDATHRDLVSSPKDKEYTIGSTDVLVCDTHMYKTMDERHTESGSKNPDYDDKYAYDFEPLEVDNE